MQDEVIATLMLPKRVPWNKGKLTGAKPPLRPKHVWSIRTKLQIEGRVRDLAIEVGRRVRDRVFNEISRRVRAAGATAFTLEGVKQADPVADLMGCTASLVVLPALRRVATDR